VIEGLIEVLNFFNYVSFELLIYFIRRVLGKTSRFWENGDCAIEEQYAIESA